MTRILVVDDSATLRRMVRAALQPLAGVEFTEADTGFAAIERLAFGPVSLIVLDLNMREMSLATQNTVKQMKLITAANREHSTVAASVQGSLGELRELSDRNVRRIQQAVGGRSNGKARNGR